MPLWDYTLRNECIIIKITQAAYYPEFFLQLKDIYCEITENVPSTVKTGTFLLSNDILTIKVSVI